MPLGMCFPYPCECKEKCDVLDIQSEPLFTDFLKNLQLEDGTIGISGLNWYGTMYPNLYTHKDRLVYRFNQHYAYREISRRDVDQWIFLLQDRFDEIADKYNHAYKLYDDEATNLDNLGLGYVRTILYGNSTSGSSQSSSSSSANSKFKDTPTNSNSTINNPTTENVDSASSSGNSSSSGQSSGNSTETYDYHDDHVVNEVNELINRYKQLDEDFIKDFNEMFIGILAKGC